MKYFFKSQKCFKFYLILIISFLLTESLPFEIGQKDEFTENISGYKNNTIEMKVFGDKEDNDYIISIYSDKNEDKRMQLGKSFKGIAKLYLPKEQFDSKIKYEIECSSYPCSGKTIFGGVNRIKLEEGEPYSFYVNDKTEKNTFLLVLNGKKSNIWARGQKAIITELKGANIKAKYENNYYIAESEGVDDVEFIVTGQQGDYINVGYVGFKENNRNTNTYIANSNILIDGPVLTGYLKKGEIEKICYGLENSSESFDYIFGTGIALTKIIYTYTEGPNGNIIQDDEKEKLFYGGIIKNTYSSDEITFNNLKQCFTFPNNEKYSNIKEIIFTYQLNRGISIEQRLNLYEPQITGKFYPRFLLKGSKAVFISHKNENFKKMSLNLIASVGYPKMYVVECDNYPLCQYDERTLKKEIRPRNINRYSTFYADKEEKFDNSPISNAQTLLVVECQSSPEEKYFDKYCEFNTLIYKDDEKIELIEDEFFNQYALENQEHNYKIKISGETNIKKIFIDVLTFIGEVNVINYEQNKNLKIDQYIAINKIYLSAKVQENSATPDEIYFTVKALSNTYYTILINFGRDESQDTLITNELQTGMSYLTTIDASKNDILDISNKIVKFKNEKYRDYSYLMINFYSLNCKIEVAKTYKDDNGKQITDTEGINYFEQFVHDVITPYNSNYKYKEYEYRLSVVENDPSRYNNKLCKIYTSSVEISGKHEDYTRDILIPDNIPQQVMFGENVKHVSYGYIHEDFQKDLLIKFNPKHKAKYKILIYYENIKREKEETIVSNDILYLEHKEWTAFCTDKSGVCYIQLDITLVDYTDEKSPVLEFSIKSIVTTSVSYFTKNVLKIDYVQNKNPQYYYTEVGEDENGFIIANFLRGSGKVYARVVKKDLDDAEKGANWRGKYRLPAENELITLDPFTKKLDFFTYGMECENGCYLLIKVVSDVEGDENDDKNIIRNYPFSLIVHGFPSDRETIPIISIPVDQYIVGCVEPISSTLIYQFYRVRLNNDADKIIFDLQSDTAELYVKFGDVSPTVDFKDFKIISDGQHNIHVKTKSELKKQSLKGLNLVIGVWTQYYDSVYTTPFAFAIRLENNDENEIFRVNSNQKVLCKTKKVGNSYRCLYAIEYDFLSSSSSSFIYANLQDKSASFKILANKMDSNYYEMGIAEKIKTYIPEEGKSDFPKEGQSKEYIYIPESEKLNSNEYLLVLVETNKETIVELVSTFFIYQSEITPNPSTTQLFLAKKGKILTLNFPEEYMEMVNLISISGNAQIYWESLSDNKYYLKGGDDRLSLTSEKSGKKHSLKINVEESTKENEFIFLLNYNIRTDSANLDALDLDKSIKYSYIDNDLPIIYYAPFTNFDISSNNYYEIFFSFNDLQNEKEKVRTFYENIPFNVYGSIVSAETVYIAKLSPTTTIEQEYKIKGVYDQATRTGMIRITNEDIKKSKTSEINKPYLYLLIDKTDEFKDVRKYIKIGVETTVLKSNSEVPISEFANQYGFLSKDETERKYILRVDKTKNYMNLQFSCFENHLSVKIQNYDLKEKETKYGKTFYSLSTIDIDKDTLTLIVYRKEPTNNDDEYFTFQYSYSDDDNYNKYSISDTTINVEKKIKNKTHADYTIKLKPVDNYNKYKLAYIIRAIYNVDFPSKPDIIVKLNKQYVKEFYDPTPSNNELSFEISDISQGIKYIQTIVQINNEGNLEYLSYDLKLLNESEIHDEDNKNDDNSNNDDNKDNNNGYLIVILIIGSMLFIVVIILVIIVIIFNNKNKNLMDQVNQISFAESLSKGDLLADNEDEKNNVIN